MTDIAEPFIVTKCTEDCVDKLLCHFCPGKRPDELCQNLRANREVEFSPVNSAPLLDVGRGNQPLKDEIMQAVSEIIDSGRFIGGPYVELLEHSVAEVCKTEFAIGCASGSDALLAGVDGDRHPAWR